MATRQDKAVAAANQLIGIANQLALLRAQINDYVTTYNNEAYSTTWGAFPTAAQNADGSLGTADGTPTAGHPIDTRVANVGLLTKAVTAAMLSSMVTCLQQLQNFFSNATVTTGNYNQSINDLAG
jgi:hypothetical protein